MTDEIIDEPVIEATIAAARGATGEFCRAAAPAARLRPHRRERGGLTGGAQVARTYDAVMDARFAEIPALLSDTCPPAPRRSASCSRVVSTWWQIQLDPHNRSQRRRHSRTQRGRRDRRRSSSGPKREPARAEAWFYLGGADRRARPVAGAARPDTGRRTGWQAHQELRSSGRSCSTPRSRTPTSGSACTTTTPPWRPRPRGCCAGCCSCRAGIASRDFEEMLRARSAGQLLRSEADYQLHLVYLLVRETAAAGPRAAAGAGRATPAQPAFSSANRRNRGRLHAEPRGQPARVADAARPGARGSGGLLRRWRCARAELGVALELYHTGQPEAAIPHLRAGDRREAASAGRRRSARAAAARLRLRPARAARPGGRGVPRRARRESRRRSVEDRAACARGTATPRADTMITTHGDRDLASSSIVASTDVDRSRQRLDRVGAIGRGLRAMKTTIF